MEYSRVELNVNLIKKAVMSRRLLCVVGLQRKCLGRISEMVSTISPDKDADYIANRFEGVLAWAYGRIKVSNVEDEKKTLICICSCADAALNSIRS